MLNTKQVEQILNKTIKKVVSSQGIGLSTRKGNKELKLLTKKIAKHPFASSEEVVSYGEKVGGVIATLSKEKGKESLDIGIIRQVSFSASEITELEKTHPIHQTKSSISSKPEVVISSKSLQSPVQETIEESVETVAEDITETAEEKTEESMDETGKTVENAVETVTEKVIEETAEKVAEEVAETTEEIKEEAKPLSLKDRISEDIKAAMKAKDKVKLETVRGIKKAILEKEVELRPKGQETLTPEQELALLSQQAKQRRDSIEQYKKGGREDLVEKEANELAIIETYLPPQLSDEELEVIITKIISELGATSPQDMGKVMGVAMKELKGKTDGKKVQGIVQSKLK